MFTPIFHIVKAYVLYTSNFYLIFYYYSTKLRHLLFSEKWPCLVESAIERKSLTAILQPSSHDNSLRTQRLYARILFLSSLIFMRRNPLAAAATFIWNHQLILWSGSETIVTFLWVFNIAVTVLAYLWFEVCNLYTTSMVLLIQSGLPPYLTCNYECHFL